MSEFKFPATLVGNGTVSTVTAFDTATGLHSANSLHPNFDKIVAGLRAGDPAVWELFSFVDAVMNRFVAISERYAWNGHDILYDGDPIKGPLADLLSKCLETGNTDDLTAVAKFGENLAMNPNLHSREQAFGWLARYNFQITSEGWVVAYKGLNDRGDGNYTSVWSSQVAGKPSAFVNGTPVPELSQVPQRVGDHVTMPRSEVKHDPSIACSRGLHAATQNYAAGYGTGVVGVILIHPRDIVSVPHEGAKMRTCGYTLVSVEADALSDAPVLSGAAVSGWQGDVGYRV